MQHRKIALSIVLLSAILLASLGGIIVYDSFNITSEEYAKSKLLPENIVNIVQLTDFDNQMNDSEKGMIDHLASVKAYLEEKSLPDNIIEKLVIIGYNQNLTSADEEFIDYIVSLDNQSQKKVVETFLADDYLSFEEKHQVQFIKTFSTAQQKIMIEDGSFANYDWDNDNMNNYFEKVIAQKPYDIYNGRYAIILQTVNTIDGIHSACNFFVNEQKIFATKCFQALLS